MFKYSVLSANFLNGTKSFLTEMEKSKIDILKKNSLSNVKIAKEVGRFEHVVRNYLTLGAKYRVKSKTTGNQKLSPRAVRSIIHQATYVMSKRCHPVK